MINSRDIQELDEHVRDVCLAHMKACSDVGIRLLVTSTYRDAEAQDDLYAIGRTKDLNRRPVTHAQSWESWHNFRCAYDVVPIVGGKPVWNERDPVWKEVVKLGKAAGAEAGADWIAFQDYPHFQCRAKSSGLHIALHEAKNRFMKYGTIFTQEG